MQRRYSRFSELKKQLKRSAGLRVRCPFPPKLAKRPFGGGPSDEQLQRRQRELDAWHSALCSCKVGLLL